MPEPDLENDYVKTRLSTNDEELLQWAKAGEKVKEEEPPKEGEPIELKKKPSGGLFGLLGLLGVEEQRYPLTPAKPGEVEPGLVRPGKDPKLSFVENMVDSLMDPVEWVSLGGAGAWQATKMGKSALFGAIDWASMGIPSMAKGIKGGAKGFIEGLGAKAKEAGTAVEKAMPIKIPKELSEILETTSKVLYEKITETSGQINTLQKNWDKLKKTATRGHISHLEAIEMGKKLIEPSLPKGYVRFYHGGEPGTGSRWVSPDYEYAAGYAAKSDSKVQYIDIPEDSSLLMKAFDDTGTNIKAPYISFEASAELMKNAKIFPKNVISIESIKQMYPGTAMNSEQASALIGTIRPLADESILAAKNFMKSGKPEDLHEALLKFYSLLQVDPKRFGVLAESGRTLSQMNEPISGINQYLNQFSNTFGELSKEGLAPMRLVRMISKFDSPGQLSIMARHTAKAGSPKSYANAILEGWIMGLLSSPKTHLVNFTGNLITTIEGIAERGIASRVAFGAGEHIQKGEATQMMYGLVSSFMDAVRVAGKALKTGVPSSGLTKIEGFSRKAISSEALDIHGGLGRGIDLLGEVTRLPGRALMTGDEFFKTLNYNMLLRAEALRAGKSQGLSGEGLSNFIENFVKNPSDSAILKARDYTNYITFQNDLGKFGQAIQSIAESNPFAKVILPFVRTPANIAKYTFERMPVINLMSGQLRKDIASGGIKRDLALAKVSMGAILTGAFVSLAKMGYITGTGPKDSKLKDEWKQAGWQENSFNIGGKFYSYRRFDPASQFIGAAADFVEFSEDLPPDEVGKYALALSLGFMNNWTSKTYLQNVSTLLEAITNPEDPAVNTVTKQFAGSTVPAIIAGITQAMDHSVREVYSEWDRIKSRVPGLSNSLERKYDLSGKPMIYEGTLGPRLLSPIFKKTYTDDPVWREIVNNEISIGQVPKIIGGARPPSGKIAQESEWHGVELTPKEYSWLSRMAGNEMKVGGKGMWDTLTDLINSPEYKKASTGPHGIRADFIKKVVYDFRRLAIMKLRKEDPELDRILKEKEKSRMETQLGRPLK